MTHIRPARADDLPAVHELLGDCGLPFTDVDADKLAHFLAASDGQELLGVVGIEPHGRQALLRSLAVRRGGAGLGTRLADAIERHARHAGFDALYLLTTGAAAFFARRGYLGCERALAPPAIRATAQFTAPCPAQAACMRLELHPSPPMKTRNILFLCTGNSARSVMAEAMATTMSGGRLQGFSAGSKPVGAVNPFAAEVAASLGYPAAALRSKSWDTFAAAGAPRMDIVITVCDNAAGETCPYWPGHPATAHWGFEDPAAAAGTEDEKRAVFRRVAAQIAARTRKLLALPLDEMDDAAVRAALQAIGDAPP